MKIPILQRFLREPLLHFTIIGGLFFLLYSFINNGGTNSKDTIVITADRIDQIAISFSQAWNRLPTEDEMDNLIEEEIRSEVYYRDALALGLDQNDAIVRRRLRQKMEFLTDTGVYLKDPLEKELLTFYSTTQNNYRKEPQLAFEQIYLGESPAQDTITEALTLLAENPGQAKSSFGKQTLLPPQLTLSTARSIDNMFGTGFYSQIVSLDPGKWDGPVSSSFGTHIVRTLDGEAARTPPFDEIRDIVERDWKALQADKNRTEDYLERRSHYNVKILREVSVPAQSAKDNR